MIEPPTEVPAVSSSVAVPMQPPSVESAVCVTEAQTSAAENEFTPAELAEIEIETARVFAEIDSLPIMTYTRSIAAWALNHEAFGYHRYYDKETPSHPNDVLKQAMRLVVAERKLGTVITDREAKMIAMVAILHDFGMDHTAATPQDARKEHEIKGAEKFKTLVAPFNMGDNFTPDEIQRMESMFLPTKLVPNADFSELTQHPTGDQLARIVQDADISNWGMSEDVILENSRREYRELKSRDPVKFLRFFTESILAKQEWKTNAGKKFYGARHKQNLKLYRALVEKLTATPPTDLKNPF